MWQKCEITFLKLNKNVSGIYRDLIEKFGNRESGSQHGHAAVMPSKANVFATGVQLWEGIWSSYDAKSEELPEIKSLPASDRRKKNVLLCLILIYWY